MFSLSYVARAASLFSKYPSALPKLANGPDAAANHIDRMRKRRWSNNPIPFKTTHGFTIILNANDNAVCPAIASGWYEPSVTELFKHLVKKGMTVVDVGANVGWFTLLAAKRVGKSGRVISFEPEPMNFSFLRRSVALNRFGWVSLHQESVAREEGTRTLYLAPENLGGHSIMERSSQASIAVRATTLDKTFRELNAEKVDVVKIDVEGADAEVLLGCRFYLPRIAHVIIEFTPASWASEPDLKRRMLDNFQLSRVVNSPFLIKGITRDEFYQIHQVTELYLRKKP